MPRSVNSVASRKRRKKIIKLAKGYFGRRKNVWTIAKNAVEKALSYAYRDRRTKKRNFRSLWITRINAASRIHGLTYSELMLKVKNKNEVPIVEFRKECRAFAEKWIEVHKSQFKRLGVIGDWENYYSTMSFNAESQIVRELGKFLKEGSLYKGFKNLPSSLTIWAHLLAKYTAHPKSDSKVGEDIGNSMFKHIKNKI